VKDNSDREGRILIKDAAKKKIKFPDIGRGERRSAARLASVQALYQMDLTQKSLNEIFAEFESHWMGQEIEGEQYKPAEVSLFHDIVQGVLDHQRLIDPLVDDTLSVGWPLKRIETVMRAILRAGTFELQHMPDTPAKVVISEYVDMASAFYDKEEVNMVNAVLDRIFKQVRP
jgi:transcription antitermination protein NusB